MFGSCSCAFSFTYTTVFGLRSLSLRSRGCSFPLKKKFERKYTVKFLKIAYLILHKAKYHTRLRLQDGEKLDTVGQS